MMDGLTYGKIVQECRPRGRAPFEVVSMFGQDGRCFLVLRHVHSFKVTAIATVEEFRHLLTDVGDD